MRCPLGTRRQCGTEVLPVLGVLGGGAVALLVLQHGKGRRLRLLVRFLARGRRDGLREQQVQPPGVGQDVVHLDEDVGGVRALLEYRQLAGRALAEGERPVVRGLDPLGDPGTGIRPGVGEVQHLDPRRGRAGPLLRDPVHLAELQSQRVVPGGGGTEGGSECRRVHLTGEPA